MYFADLTPYNYLSSETNHSFLCVGWLDNEHEFSKGEVPKCFLDKIMNLCFNPNNQTRGFHKSPFSENYPYEISYKGKKKYLGSAEIRVVGKNGITYVAPDLIYHYIKDCGYLPPKEFIDSVCS